MLVSVFIPFCNEEKNLAEIIERTEKGGIEAGVDIELVFVDDGSGDQTAALIREIASGDERVRYTSFSRNFGKEAGHRISRKISPKEAPRDTSGS